MIMSALLVSPTKLISGKILLFILLIEFVTLLKFTFSSSSSSSSSSLSSANESLLHQESQHHQFKHQKPKHAQPQHMCDTNVNDDDDNLFDSDLVTSDANDTTTTKAIRTTPTTNTNCLNSTQPSRSNKNESYILASSLEPIYFGRASKGLNHKQIHGDQSQESPIADQSSQPQKQEQQLNFPHTNLNNLLSSFYSFGDTQQLQQQLQQQLKHQQQPALYNPNDVGPGERKPPDYHQQTQAPKYAQDVSSPSIEQRTSEELKSLGLELSRPELKKYAKHLAEMATKQLDLSVIHGIHNNNNHHQHRQQLEEEKDRQHFAQDQHNQHNSYQNNHNHHPPSHHHHHQHNHNNDYQQQQQQQQYHQHPQNNQYQPHHHKQQHLNEASYEGQENQYPEHEAHQFKPHTNSHQYQGGRFPINESSPTEVVEKQDIKQPIPVKNAKTHPVIQPNETPTKKSDKVKNSKRNKQSPRQQFDAKLNDVYRMLKKKKQLKHRIKNPQKVNLAKLLKPGDVLLIEKEKVDDKVKKANAGYVEPDEIFNLLQKLQPLSVDENEKTPTLPEADEQEEDDDEEDDDAAPDKQTAETKDGDESKDNKVKRILPTSHLFGGSVGVVDESKLRAGSEANAGEADEEEEIDEANQKEKSAAKEKQDDALLLKSLADLGAKLSSAKTDPLGGEAIEHKAADSELFELYGRNERARDPRTKLRLLDKQSRMSKEDEERLSSSIPIEVLVDHLMSSSRLATFGVQHTGVKSPKYKDEDEESPTQAHSEDDEDQEDSDDDDDDDQTSSDSEANESVRTEVKMLPSFEAVSNSSDSWIPLDKITVNNKQLLQGHADKQFSRVKRKKRAKDRRSKRNRNQDLVLVIGDKMLNRTDLIRLIRVLNKMASRREPSKERDSSRRLLRFLVKLALDEYRKNKNSHRYGDEKNDPIREVLRSVLMGPIYGKSLSDNDTVIELKPVNKQQQESSRDEKRSVDSEFDYDDDDSKKAPTNGTGKTLNDLTDDLELYFESDFFEDLADKMAANKTIEHPKTAQRKLRRASRLGYSLPVPIYGKQHIEGPDEDEVELENVKLNKNRPIKPRRNIKANFSENQTFGKMRSSEGPDEEDEEQEPEPNEEEQSKPANEKPVEQMKPNKAPSVRHKPIMSESLNRQSKNIENNDDSGEPDHPDDEAEPKIVLAVKEKKPKKIKSDQKLGKENEMNATESPKTKKVALNEEQKNTDDKEQKVTVNQPEPDVQNAEGEEEEEEETPVAEKEKEKQVEPEQSVQPKANRRKKRGRRRRGSAGKKRLASGTQLDIDLDERDEIPAPILGGKVRKNATQENLVNKRKEPELDETIREIEAEVKVEKKPKTIKPKAKKKKKNKAKKTVPKLKEKVIEETKDVNTPTNKEPKKKIKGRQRREKSDKINNDKQKQELPKKSVEKKQVLKNNNVDPDEPLTEADEPERNQSASTNRESEMPESDYYENEGTSYSKICEDDGKCSVSVQSTHPKLSQAIQTRNKPQIEKHLGKWIESSD